MDIELRFEQRISRDSRSGFINILQQRTKTEHRESSTTTPAEAGWTKWEDVPVVQEGA